MKLAFSALDALYTDGIVLFFVAVMAACVGSFLTVVIYRLPKIMMHEWQQDVVDFIAQSQLAPSHQATVRDAFLPTAKLSLSAPRSHCPHCQTPIAWRNNVPLISYLRQRGRCQHCQQPIARGYFLIELVTLLLSVLMVMVFGLSIKSVLGLMFTWLLIALSGIDWQVQLLPDRLIVPLAMIGLLANVWGIFSTPEQAILGGIGGFMTLWLINTVFRRLRGYDGMGMGDAKLLAALGAWFGMMALPMILFLAALFGVVAGLIHRRHGQTQAFAFGPYLAMAGLLVFYFGDSWLIDYFI